MKKPSFQFYPGDWRKDPAIQALDFESRGVWFEMLLLMHESDERGKLVLNGQPIPEDALARILSISVESLKQILSKLLAYGVAKQEQNTGKIYSKRMVEDERITALRREAGRKGGKQKPSKTQANVKQNRPPSSSTSSSTSVNPTTPLEETANKILEYWNTKKLLPTLRGGITKVRARCVKAIVERLEEGYTDEDLIRHIDKFNGKVIAQRWHENRYGEEPSPNSLHWCPNQGWNLWELFGRERFMTYFPRWEREEVLTQDFLNADYARRNY
jgi:hypothetical protein